MVATDSEEGVSSDEAVMAEQTLNDSQEEVEHVEESEDEESGEENDEEAQLSYKTMNFI